MTTAMDPAAVMTAGTAAEQLSGQASATKPKLAGASDSATAGTAKTETAAAIQSGGGVWDQSITVLAKDMDQQGMNLTNCSKQQSSTEAAVAQSLQQIRN
jgi:hypothetical protein